MRLSEEEQPHKFTVTFLRLDCEVIRYHGTDQLRPSPQQCRIAGVNYLVTPRRVEFINFSTRPARAECICELPFEEVPDYAKRFPHGEDVVRHEIIETIRRENPAFFHEQ